MHCTTKARRKNISHIGLTSRVLCHGVQKLEQNGWFRPESFRSNACNASRSSSRSFVVSFNFARTVSADRYGMLIKMPPSSKNCLAFLDFAKSSASAPSYTKHFTALKLFDRMVLTNVCINLRDVALSLIFFYQGLGCQPNFCNQKMWSV